MRNAIIINLAALLFVAGCSYQSSSAQLIQSDEIPNFHKVDDNLYRSGQPTEKGMKILKDMGIKTIINLRTFHTDSDEISSTGLLNEQLHMNVWHIEDEDVVRALKIVSHSENGPFLIHCQHGSDRTGVICAMYRIIFNGWSKEMAIDEMVNGGCGFHRIWSNIIDYVRYVDEQGIINMMEKTE